MGSQGTLFIEIFLSIIMLILGINLLDIFPWAKKFQPVLPSFFVGHIQELKELNHTATPFLVGVATFFLPCGFTQSMQLYSISTGNFLTGAMIMLSFALGTLPVLALLSFCSSGLLNKLRSGVLFKTAGLVVVFLAFFNLQSIAIRAGIAGTLKMNRASSGGSELNATEATQVIKIVAKGGFTPAISYAKAGVPAILKVKTQGTFDCSTTLTIPSIGLAQNLGPTGEYFFNIPAQKAGTTLLGGCSMGMYNFKIVFN